MMCLLQVLLCVLHSGVFITPIVGLCINRFTSCCAPTLGHFSAYNRPSPSFPFLPLFFTGHSTSSHFLGLFIGGLFYHSMKFFLIFLLKRQRAPMLKAVMTAVSASCTNLFFTAGSTDKQIQSLSSKDTGSSGQQ